MNRRQKIVYWIDLFLVVVILNFLLPTRYGVKVGIAQAIVILFVWSLIGAIVLRAATKWVVKWYVPFGEAYWTVFVSSIVNFMLGFVLSFVVGSTGSTEAVRVLQVILLPVGFLIQSGIISWRLELPFGKACLVSITMTGIVLGIALVLGLIFFLIIIAVGS
jgi:hypothetical protein